MNAMVIHCPSCSTGMRPAQDPVPGSRIRCPTCGTVFTVAVAVPVAVQAPSTVRVARAAAPPLAAVPGPAPAPRGGRAWVLLFLLGTLLLLGGSAVGLAYVFSHGSPREKPPDTPARDDR